AVDIPCYKALYFLYEFGLLAYTVPRFHGGCDSPEQEKPRSRTSTPKEWVLLKIKEKAGSRTSTPKDWVLLKIKEKAGSRTSTLKDWVLLKIKEKAGSRTSTPKEWVVLKIKEKAGSRTSTMKDWVLLKIKEGRKPNKYTEGMGSFKDQAEGLVDHFRTSATGMDIASKHVSTNKALKEIKKEDDDFPII
ncbi:hypothetical protein Tco_1470740, partial [Tanacetum coccineum]